MPLRGEPRKMALTSTKTNLKHLLPFGRISIGSLIDINKLVLFGCAPGEIPPIESRADLDIRKMTAEDLLTLSYDSGRLSDQARLYYVKRGIDAAYGAYLDEELVHMSWVYTAAEYSKEPFRRLALEDREVEIVNCFTLDRCRGMGIYPHMIRFLSDLQFQNGVKRVYMMANHKNEASQRGIIKAGLKILGRVTYLRVPASSSKSIYYRRYQKNMS